MPPPGGSVLLLQADIRRAVRGGARRVGFALGQPIQDASAEILTGPRHGRRYLRRGRVHVASAPGEAPAEDTGNLRRNVRLISTVEPEGDGMRVSAELVYFAAYAARVNVARPWFAMVMERAQPGIDQVLSSGVLRAGGFR